MRRRGAASLLAVASLCYRCAAPEREDHSARETDDPRASPSIVDGSIVRGPRSEPKLALLFTGGYFADGSETILAELGARSAKASFFLTGDFLRQEEFAPLIERIRDEGHYVGPHSDKHLLYASWEQPPRLLVTRSEFDVDLERNLRELERFGVPMASVRYFLPPYEHATQEIADWTHERGMVLVGITPGTRSHADYIPERQKGFLTASEIIASILRVDDTDPDGLSGFLLLMHIGVGPGRATEHLYDRLGELLDELGSRGYRFVRVDELLARD